MVLWCKWCGALVGLREPVRYWFVDRWAICEACAREFETVQPANVDYSQQTKSVVLKDTIDRIEKK